MSSIELIVVAFDQADKADGAAKFAATKAEIDRRMAALAEKQAAMRQELYADTTAQIQAWQPVIEALETQIETSAADKKAELRQQVEVLREKVKTGRETLNKKIEEQLREWQTDIVDLRTRATNATHQAKVALYQQIEVLQLKQDAAWAEMQQNLTAQVETRRAEVETLKANVAESAAEPKAKLQAQLATAQANWVSAWDKLQTAMETQLDEVEAALDVFEVQVAIGKMEAKDDFNEFIATLQARRYAAQQKFQHALETQLQELETNVDQNVETLCARQAQIEAKLQELRTSSRAARQDLASGFAKAKEVLQEAREAAVAEFK